MNHKNNHRSASSSEDFKIDLSPKTTYSWHEMPKENINTPPVHGDTAIVYLPVIVTFLNSDRIVTQVDEENNPVEFKQGLVMHIHPQTAIYEEQERQHLYNSTTK